MISKGPVCPEEINALALEWGQSTILVSENQFWIHKSFHSEVYLRAYLQIVLFNLLRLRKELKYLSTDPRKCFKQASLLIKWVR